MKLSLFFSVSCFFCFVCDGIETPQFTVIHSESDFEIRLYRESSWMSAPVDREVSFEKATKSGFHRLYQYIHGANTNSTRISMTAPVLTSVIPDVRGGLQYIVRYYMSPKFQQAGVPPPHALSELNLQFAKLGKRCMAVRKFSGFARNNTVTKQVQALVTDLGRLQTGGNSSSTSTTPYDKYGYTIAQYNASYHQTGRLNEVWMNISGLTRVVDGCQSI